MRAELDNYVPNTTFISSVTNTAQNLVSFGQEVNEATQGQGYAFFKINSNTDGNAYLAYKIGNNIEVDLIGFSDTPLPNKSNLFEGLIYTIRNMAASLGKKLILKDIDEDLKQFLLDRNDKLKKQKIEDIYKWKLIT